MTELIEQIFQAGHIEKALEDAALMQRLTQLVRRKKKVPEALAEIMYDLYPQSEKAHQEGMEKKGKQKKGKQKKRFVEKWDLFYGDEGFRFKMSEGVNRVNYNETVTYLKLFEKQKTSMEHMENATATLLLTLPCDADTIADIGSGPGLVNQFIPYYYDVLAVDLNEEILKQNSRKTCIGDILDLPLQDQSVDMTMTCDVLEHLEPEKLNQAVAELRRVSRKYIYIQTPYNEILRYSIARCPKCGNVWHVNFHKSKFTLDTLRKYENEEWRVSEINYTGYVCNEADNPDIYHRIDAEQMDIYRVDHFECPKCGTDSKPVNLAMLEEMEKQDNRRENGREITPKYTEIGVLFEKTGRTGKALSEHSRIKKENTKIKEDSIYSNLKIDFKKKFLTKKVYTGKEQIPVIFSNACQIEKTEQGIMVKGGDGSWLGISLPYMIAGASLELRGICEQDMKLVIVGIDGEENEFQETQNQIAKGSFVCEQIMSMKWKEHSTFIKLYCESAYVLSEIKIHGKDEKKYYFFTQEDVEDDHYMCVDHGIVYRYYIPRQGVAFEKADGIMNRTGWKVI